MKEIQIGLFGLGTVGRGVAEILLLKQKALAQKAGAHLVLKKVCVKHLRKEHPSWLNRRLLTTLPSDILEDPTIDIVVELIGGIHPAKEILIKALDRGKHVVTANKALMAESGIEIFNKVKESGLLLGLEASVCAGIPIIQSLRQGLAANEISHLLGIVNGTSNYILSGMFEEGCRFDEGLKKAQACGYAEMNPHLDISGIDSAHKLAILARIAFQKDIRFRDIYVEGIERLSTIDVDYIQQLGYTVKLLAIGKKEKELLDLRVHPTLLPKSHVLSNVRGVYNAVFVRGSQVGDMLFYGKGAGRFPTASAVMSDLIDIARHHESQVSSERPIADYPKAKVQGIEEIVSSYYLRFNVVDRPRVLARIADRLGQRGISILSVHQKEFDHRGGFVPVVVLTHQAKEKKLRQALFDIDRLNIVRQKTIVIRMER